MKSSAAFIPTLLLAGVQLGFRIPFLGQVELKGHTGLLPPGLLLGLPLDQLPPESHLLLGLFHMPHQDQSLNQVADRQDLAVHGHGPEQELSPQLQGIDILKAFLLALDSVQILLEVEVNSTVII